MDGTLQVRTGEISGSTSAKQLTQTDGSGISCRAVKIKAVGNNVGSVYVGYSSSVTTANGTSDQTTGWPLAPGEEQIFTVDNLNRLYIRCDNAGDDIVYICFL